MGRKGSMYHQFINAEGVFINASTGGKVSDRSSFNYKRDLRYAAEFYKAEGCNDLDKLGVEDVKRYTDHMIERGLSASTIHSRLAPLCKAMHLNMAEIDNKPIRYTADYTKGSHHSNVDGGIAAEFNSIVGVRRHDLLRLRGNSIVEIKGITYVVIDKSKGGKEVHQRILPQHVEAVKANFNGSVEKIFILGADIKAKYDYHQHRRNIAQEAYAYYLERCSTPEGRREVYRELAAYWHAHNKKGHKLEPFERFDRPYVLRGKNRQLAIAQGRPVSYDRLALRAVSTMHLAHWRDSVTIASYMCYR